MQRSLSIVLLPAFALACAEGEAPLPDGLPNFRISQDVLEVGIVSVGDSGTGAIQVENHGARPLTLVATSASDDVVPTLASPTLNPGDQTDLEVRVTPSAEGAQEVNVTIAAQEQPSLQRTVTVAFRTAVGALSCDPATLSFGNVVLDTTATLSIECTSRVDVDANVELLEGDNLRRCSSGSVDSSVFCVRPRDRNIGPDGTFSLRAGESVEIEVDFTPVLAGTRERGSFVLRFCESSGCETEIRVDGLGVEQGLRCEPAAVDFGPTPPGQCQDRTLTCTNIANALATVVSWSLGTGSDSAFEVEPAAATALRSEEALEVDLRFCPDALGTASGQLVLQTEQAGSNRTLLVALAGRGGGPDIQVLPEEVDFGTAAVASPVRQTVVVLNPGFDDLEIADVLADDAATGAFRVVRGGPTVVPPGGSASFVIEFVPPAPGPYMSGLRLRTNTLQGDLLIPLSGTGVVLPPCQSTLSATTLDFGDVQVGRQADLAIALSNTGVDDCLIGGVRLAPGSAPEFSVDGAPTGPVVVSSGASLVIPVRYRPSSAGMHRAQLELSVSNPTAPLVQIALTGDGIDAAPALLSRTSVDFGRVVTGCGATTRALRVHNPNARSLVVSQVGLRNGAASPFGVAVGNLPATIAPGEQITLQVSFAPTTSGPALDALLLSGTSGGTPVSVVVGLSGAAAPMAEQVDAFTQGTPKVDALFVADFSAASSTERTLVSSEFASFIRAADAAGLDYQVGITTTDVNDEGGRLLHATGAPNGAFMGPFGNRIITRSTQPSPAAVFETNLLGRLSSGGAPIDEAGMWSAYLALTPPILTTSNAGFLRPDADLMIIIIADEPDGSRFANVGAPSLSLDFYLDYFRSLKAPGRRARVSAIAGPNPGGCSGPSGAAAATPWYVEAAQRTGGTFASICSTDYAAVLDDIGEVSFGPSQAFELSQPAVLASVAVAVDGVPVPRMGNWQFDATAGRVEFSPFAIPPAGSTVQIRYAVACQ